jgi:hypothetical protein
MKPWTSSLPIFDSVPEERHEMNAQEALVALQRRGLASHRRQVGNEPASRYVDAQALGHGRGNLPHHGA